MPVNDGFEASKATQSLGGVPIEGDNPEIATRIKELIDTYACAQLRRRIRFASSP